MCDPCREAYRPRCLTVAQSVWESIPWKRRLDSTLVAHIGQYVDSRFLVEVLFYGFQRLFDELRRSMLGPNFPVERSGLSVDEAKQLVQTYAPRRVVSETTAEQILDAHLRPVAEDLLKELRRQFALVGHALDLRKAEEWQEDIKDRIAAYVRDSFPSGQVYVRCLHYAAILMVPPHRVFRHLAFGESVVDEPWTLDWEKGRIKLAPRRQLNFGPYLGRFPPYAWAKLGLGQSLANQIRLWTCLALEQLGSKAREAMARWDEATFHDYPFDADREPHGGTTSPAESNYARDKRWLARRLATSGSILLHMWTLTKGFDSTYGLSRLPVRKANQSRRHLELPQGVDNDYLDELLQSGLGFRWVPDI